MTTLQRIACCFAVCALAMPASAETQQTAAKDRQQHDFDFDIGVWNSKISRLEHPLTGSKTWAEWEATVTVTPVWEGRANIEELEADGPTGQSRSTGAASVQSADA